MNEKSKVSECDICCNKITKEKESPLTCGHTLFHVKCLAQAWEVKIN